MRFRHVHRDAYLFTPLSVSDEVDAIVNETEDFLRTLILDFREVLPHMESKGSSSHPLVGRKRCVKDSVDVWSALLPLEHDLVSKLRRWMPCVLSLDDSGSVHSHALGSSSTARFLVGEGIPKSFAASLISVLTSPHVMWLLAAGSSEPLGSFNALRAADTLLSAETYLKAMELWELPSLSRSSSPRRQKRDGTSDDQLFSTPDVFMSPIQGDGGVEEQAGAAGMADMSIGEYETQQQALHADDTRIIIGSVMSSLEMFTLRMSLDRALLTARSSSVHLCKTILSAGLESLRHVVSTVAEDRGGFKTDSCTNGGNSVAAAVLKAIDGVLSLSLDELACCCGLAVQVAIPTLCGPDRRVSVILARSVDFESWSDASAWFNSGLKQRPKAMIYTDGNNTSQSSQFRSYQHPSGLESVGGDVNSSSLAAGGGGLNALRELSAAGKLEIEKALVRMFRLVLGGAAVHNVQHLVLTPLLRRDRSPFAMSLSESALASLATLYYKTLFVELERFSLGSDLRAVYINGDEFHLWAQHELSASGRVWNFHNTSIVLHERSGLQMVQALRNRFSRVGIVCPADKRTILMRAAHDLPLDSYPLLEYLNRHSSIAEELAASPLQFSPMRLACICDSADIPMLRSTESCAASSAHMWCPVDLPLLDE